MSDRRAGWILFAMAWLAFAWFHQGGGWNQNGRFALARAIVEERRPWIDEFAVYVVDPSAGTTHLTRLPVHDGRLTTPRGVAALAWTGRDGRPSPLDPATPPGTPLIDADSIAASGDLAYARGHLHPNKAPGTSFAAVPAYAAAYVLERGLGIDPDDARVLTVNAWWTGAGSVALVAALGVLLFFRAALKLSGGHRAGSLTATLAFAFGTLYFPYATMLYEHDLVAVATLAAVVLLLDDAPGTIPLLGAGALLGAAIVTNYFALVTAGIVIGYVALRLRRVREPLILSAGLAPPLGVLAIYNLACFGTMVTTNYAWQNPLFKDSAGGFLGVFRLPDPGVFLALIGSPYRGLFVTSPALLLGGWGLARMIATPGRRREGWLFIFLVLHLFAFNVTFTAWHGGWAAGPRYLVPAIPFLALPIVFVPSRFERAARALVAISFAATFIVTAVDPQPPVGASLVPESRAAWTLSPLLDFDLPLFLHGEVPGWLTAGSRFPSSLWSSPVSANPQGMYESWPAHLFPPGSAVVRGNSFNVGEWLLGERRLSLFPLLAALLLGAAALYRGVAQAPGSAGARAR